MAEHRGDGGQRYPGGDRGDPVGVAKSLRAGLRAFDVGGAHERSDVAARRRPGEGPKRRPRASRAALRAAQPVHELELTHQVLGHRDRAPVFAPAFQRPEPQLRGLEVDVLCTQRERLRNPAPGVGEGERKGLGRGWARAAVRNQARSSPVRYFRPLASTRVKPTASAMAKTIHYD